MSSLGILVRSAIESESLFYEREREKKKNKKNVF